MHITAKSDRLTRMRGSISPAWWLIGIAMYLACADKRLLIGGVQDEVVHTISGEIVAQLGPHGLKRTRMSINLYASSALVIRQ